MGLSSKKQKTSSAETSTATTTPNVPSFLSQPYQTFASNVAQLNPSGMGAVGASPLQQGAFTAAQGLGGGRSTLQGLMNYAPERLDTSGNPWENDVVGTTLADLERSRAGAISAGQGAATSAGAYGGSRHGVADSLTNEAFGRTAASTAANLRSQGFLNMQDAQRFNVNSDLQGAGLRLNAANALGEDERANTGLMGDLGAQQRAIEMENDRWRRQAMALAMQGGLLGAIPGNLFTGQTVNASGTQNTTTTQTPSMLDSLGRIASIFSSFSGKGG